jgi:hypothetical protein
VGVLHWPDLDPEMSRSAASQAAARYANLKRVRRNKMNICEVCLLWVYTDQKSTWMILRGDAIRIHEECRPVS